MEKALALRVKKGDYVLLNDGDIGVVLHGTYKVAGEVTLLTKHPSTPLAKVAMRKEGVGSILRKVERRKWK